MLINAIAFYLKCKKLISIYMKTLLKKSKRRSTTLIILQMITKKKMQKTPKKHYFLIQKYENPASVLLVF